MITGNVFDIKRLAVHDGPGLRTTVFLKGCSLRCLWCHNPESVSPKPEIGYRARKCLACGKCVAVCPVGAHAIHEQAHVFDRSRCTACGACVAACLPEALELYGQEMPVEEIAAAVLEDRTFYDKSGGGCTVSGGEPLLQAEFCAALFQNLRQKGVHCAIDTSGAVPWRAFETVLPVTDLFLYDLKSVDDERHREQVGSSNQTSLDNLRKLAEHDRPVEVRIPVIPGFNADLPSIKAIGALLGKLRNITGIRLLPYHLARSKYETVGHRDTMPQAPAPEADELRAFASALASFNLPVLSSS